MNTDGMARLLGEILDSQLETGQYGVLDEERIRAALTNGPPLDEHEHSLLLLSPVARYDYERIRAEVKQEMLDRLHEQQVELEMLPLAAASDADKNILRGRGFTVTLLRQEHLGIPWIILVQLGPEYLEAISPLTVLRLVDSGGLEWLRGKPDRNGEITAPWSDPETDLLARSRRFSLTLEPV